VGGPAIAKTASSQKIGEEKRSEDWGMQVGMQLVESEVPTANTGIEHGNAAHHWDMEEKGEKRRETK